MYMCMCVPYCRELSPGRLFPSRGVRNSYYTPDRSLPQIHEVIFNNPEGLLNITECIRGRDQSKGCNN